MPGIFWFPRFSLHALRRRLTSVLQCCTLPAVAMRRSGAESRTTKIGAEESERKLSISSTKTAYRANTGIVSLDCPPDCPSLIFYWPCRTIRRFRLYVVVEGRFFADETTTGSIVRQGLFYSTILGVAAFCAAARAVEPTTNTPALDLPDKEIVEAYRRAATQNVLTAVNPKVFDGYFSVCADGIGFGYGCTYPSLDGHQMTDALLFLGQVGVANANWDYVRKFQRPDGQLPIAILPSSAGQMIGPPNMQSKVDANGGLYVHWVPGNPLRALAGPTYIQNADVIFRCTQDRQWLLRQLPSINLAADYLASLTDDEGAVRGAGYYVERPTRIEYDGVAQCHAVDAFQRVAAMNLLAGKDREARRYQKLADRIVSCFRRKFWVKDKFAEYIHPQRGVIANHGLTDVDWAAIATGAASAEQTAVLWPRLKDEKRFLYGGMPSGIAALPETYEGWEFTTGANDRYDLAAMGRVWYLESWARARMGDGQGLLESIRKVCQVGRESGYYWRERYTAKGGHGAQKYCEYPANLIRIVQRFLLGVEFGLDGTLEIASAAPDEFWKAGFGQTLTWRGRTLSYRIGRDGIAGDYWGKSPQRLRVKLPQPARQFPVELTIDGRPAKATADDDRWVVLLPAAPATRPCHFELRGNRR
jgi:hypothetical protein